MKKKKLAIWCLVLVLLAVAGVAAFNALGKKDLDDSQRNALGGDYIKVSDGWVHYKLSGPEDGPVVVLVHGFSTPMFVWGPVAQALAAKGFRVLQYDLFGRGFSDRPKVKYNEDLFVRQLHELLAALGIESTVNLAGLSMGGAIGTLFTARYPEKVKRLVLVGPAGFPVNMPFVAKIVKTPAVGDVLMATIGEFAINGGADKALYDKSKAPGFLARFKEQLAYKGYMRSLLSTLRHFDLNDQAAAFSAVGRQGTPVLLVWGEQDEIVPFANHKQVLAAMPDARFLPVARAGHIPNYEAPQEVVPAMAEFLRGPSYRPAAVNNP